MNNKDEKQIARLGLSEKDGTNRPGIVEEMLVDLREALPGLFVDLFDSGRTWLRGKSAQEAARAQQILSDVIDRIGRLKLDEREQQHRHVIENQRHDVDIEQKRMELYLSSLERATKVVKELAEMGVDVDITAILRGLPVHIDAITLERPDTHAAASPDSQPVK
jgi:hypothetical protein